jgi:hypothetical protein
MPAADPPIRDDTHALGLMLRRPGHVQYHKAIVSTLSLGDVTTPPRTSDKWINRWIPESAFA